MVHMCCINWNAMDFSSILSTTLLSIYMLYIALRSSNADASCEKKP